MNDLRRQRKVDLLNREAQARGLDCEYRIKDGGIVCETTTEARYRRSGDRMVWKMPGTGKEGPEMVLLRWWKGLQETRKTDENP